MTEKSYGWITGIAALAAVGVGGYIIYSFLKNNPISQAITNVSGGVEKGVEGLTTPLLNQVLPSSPKQTSGTGAITPLQALVPITTLPNIIDTLSTQKAIGGVSYAASLFPPAAVIQATQNVLNSNPRQEIMNRPIPTTPAQTAAVRNLGYKERNPIAGYTPVKTTVTSPVTYQKATASLHGLINPATGFRYSGR